MSDEYTLNLPREQTFKQLVQEIHGIRSLMEKESYICYGMRIQGDGLESDPDSLITYLKDSVGMTPAHMDYTNDVFDYGSWKDAFFMPKPCILKQSGKVQCYLDPDNYEKDIDGNTVAIDENLTGANVMIEFPKIWLKIIPEADPRNAEVYISNKKLDEDFKDYAYIASDKTHKEHFYMPAFNGSLIDSVLRSLSGQALMKSKTAQNEIDYATANGTGWYTEDAGEVMLINFLLLLMAKTADTKKAYGQGLHTGGSEAINNNFRTGVHKAKGLFYGTNSGAIADGSYGNAVKVFGIENWWGLQWRKYAGDILDGTNGIKSKLCWGQEDGSTTDNFNLDGSGYVATGAIPSGTSGQYIKEMLFTKNGMYSTVNQSNSAYYFTSGQWFNTGQVDYALRGGSSYAGALVCAMFVDRYYLASFARWNLGAAPAYK